MTKYLSLALIFVPLLIPTTITYSASSNFTQQIYEITECNDGIDNDGDGGIDFATDDQCVSWEDPSETVVEPICSDTVDNDSDGLRDFPLDPQCSSAEDMTEDIQEPQCNDGIDNDTDTFIDFPDDPECTDAADNTEEVVIIPPEPPVSQPVTEPNEPAFTPNIITDIVTSDFVNDVITGIENIVFNWSPLGNVLGVNTFSDIQDLPLQNKVPVITVTSILFAVVSAIALIPIHFAIRLFKKYVFTIFIPKAQD
jgi:hypothetical protein